MQIRRQAKFLERQQALLHGDLHTGSLMVTESTTHVIDAEFAFVGPIAFDVAKMVANLLIAYFASFGLESRSEPREEQRAWLLRVRWEAPFQPSLCPCSVAPVRSHPLWRGVRVHTWDASESTIYM